MTDKQRFTELIDQNQGIIHKVCSLYSLDSEMKKDIYQEVILRLWKSFPKFRGDSKFSTWMYRVALNTTITYVRQQQKRKTDAIGDDSKNIPDTSDGYNEDQIRMLYKAIKQLNEVDRAIIMLYLDEKSYDEISEIMGMTVSNIGVRINRAKVKLEKILTPHF